MNSLDPAWAPLVLPDDGRVVCGELFQAWPAAFTADTIARRQAELDIIEAERLSGSAARLVAVLVAGLRPSSEYPGRQAAGLL